MFLLEWKAPISLVFLWSISDMIALKIFLDLGYKYPDCEKAGIKKAAGMGGVSESSFAFFCSSASDFVA